MQNRNVAVTASIHWQSPKAVVFDVGSVITSSHLPSSDKLKMNKI